MTTHMWAAIRSNKTRNTHGYTLGRPSTAEIRRWLNDRATPRQVKCDLYAWLLFRRTGR